jgi:hypothetical protein
MPTVRGIDAKAKQIARLIVGKVTGIAAKARSSLIVGKVRQIAANLMGVEKPIVAKETIASAV